MASHRPTLGIEPRTPIDWKPRKSNTNHTVSAAIELPSTFPDRQTIHGTRSGSSAAAAPAASHTVTGPAVWRGSSRAHSAGAGALASAPGASTRTGLRGICGMRPRDPALRTPRRETQDRASRRRSGEGHSGVASTPTTGPTEFGHRWRRQTFDDGLPEAPPRGPYLQVDGGGAASERHAVICDLPGPSGQYRGAVEQRHSHPGGHSAMFPPETARPSEKLQSHQ